MNGADQEKSAQKLRRTGMIVRHMSGGDEEKCRFVEKLRDWAVHLSNKEDIKLLLIDDEADNASINISNGVSVLPSTSR